MNSGNSESNISWTRLIAAYKASGKSKVAFCQERGIKAHQLAYYIKMQNKRMPAKGGDFARVAVPKVEVITSSEKPMARLKLSNGATIDFTLDADPVWAARLISHLGRQI